MTAGRHLENR